MPHPDRTDADAPEEMVIPLAEETATIAKREVVTGRVRVRTVVDTAEEMARAMLQTETVEVERVPVDREVDAPPQVRTEGDTLIVPVVEEIMVVEKRLVLKEELRIRRVTTQEEVEVPVTLRRQRAEVERADGEGAPAEPTAQDQADPSS